MTVLSVYAPKYRTCSNFLEKTPLIYIVSKEYTIRIVVSMCFLIFLLQLVKYLRLLLARECLCKIGGNFLILTMESVLNNVCIKDFV